MTHGSVVDLPACLVYKELVETYSHLGVTVVDLARIRMDAVNPLAVDVSLSVTTNLLLD